jgi:hypothetical protein
MKYGRRNIVIVAAALLSAAVLAAPMRADAQTILKFSHTDSPGGSRQAAAELPGARERDHVASIPTPH